MTSSSWEHEADPRRFRSAFLGYWTGTSNQRGRTENRHHQNIRRSAAARELHRDRGEPFHAKGFSLSPASKTNMCFWIVASFVGRIAGFRIGITSGGWASSTRRAPPMSLTLSDFWITPARSRSCCTPNHIPLTRRLSDLYCIFCIASLAGLYLVWDKRKMVFVSESCEIDILSYGSCILEDPERPSL